MIGIGIAGSSVANYHFSSKFCVDHRSRLVVLLCKKDDFQLPPVIVVQWFCVQTFDGIMMGWLKNCGFIPNPPEWVFVALWHLGLSLLSFLFNKKKMMMIFNFHFSLCHTIWYYNLILVIIILFWLTPWFNYKRI